MAIIPCGIKCDPVFLGVCIFSCLVLYQLWYSSVSDPHKMQRSPGVSHAQDWAPPQDDIDYWENRAPMVHCPHGSDRRSGMLDKLNKLVAANVSGFCSCPEELTFLLVTNMAGDKFPVAEQLYQLCGCRYVHIRLDKTAWPGWQWSYKVGGEISIKC